MSDELSLSIIIPVYNETRILERTVETIAGRLADGRREFEIVLVENGSSDGSVEICDRLAKKIPNVRTVHLPEPDYGRALQNGILCASNDLMVNFSADWWDLEFLEGAIPMMGDHDLVIGIKTSDDNLDKRSWVRRYGSGLFQFLERALFPMPVRDTHGLKVAKLNRIQPIARKCRFGQEVFETELALRCLRAGVRFGELKLSIHEVRPGRINILKRGLRALWHLAGLRLTLWMEQLRLIPERAPAATSAMTTRPRH